MQLWFWSWKRKLRGFRHRSRYGAAKRRAKRRSVLAAAWRWTWRLIAIAIVVDVAYLAYLWPDWEKLQEGGIPKSNFIAQYEKDRKQDKSLPKLRWHPVSYWKISPNVRRAVIVAEDSRFYYHSGFDVQAFMEVMDYNWERGRIAYGASTISQQTIKNLFLSAAKTPLRKWHELVLTWGMEYHLEKRRILELYLNIAEFGVGIYGVDAAAWYYWGIPAKELSYLQAVELVASLPNPKQSNPASRTRFFLNRRDKILRQLEAAERYRQQHQ